MFPLLTKQIIVVSSGTFGESGFSSSTNQESDFEFKKADWSIICCGPIHNLQIMLQIHLHEPAIALSRICTHALSRSALVNAGSLKTNTGTQKYKI